MANEKDFQLKSYVALGENEERQIRDSLKSNTKATAQNNTRQRRLSLLLHRQVQPAHKTASDWQTSATVTLPIDQALH